MPSRLYTSPSKEKPLAGARISIKDNYDLKGIRTTMMNRAYNELYPPRTSSADYVSRHSSNSVLSLSERPKCLPSHLRKSPRISGLITTAPSTQGAICIKLRRVVPLALVRRLRVTRGSIIRSVVILSVVTNVLSTARLLTLAQLPEVYVFLRRTTGSSGSGHHTGLRHGKALFPAASMSGPSIEIIAMALML